MTAIVVILLGNELFIPLSGILVSLWARLSGVPWLRRPPAQLA
jgi:hypothetical protein